MLQLDYTGHPLFDVGLAAMTAFVYKDNPADLTYTDLTEVADYIETYYTQQPLSSFLTVSLMNSDFTQPAFKDNPERKRAYAARVARSFGPDIARSETVCVFTGQPALIGYFALSEKGQRGKRRATPRHGLSTTHSPDYR